MNAKEETLIDRIAKGINDFFSRWFIPFTTPFFALYNCFKLMNGVQSKSLRIVIFVVSMIYVIMSLVLAIYVVIIKKKG